MGKFLRILYILSVLSLNACSLEASVVDLRELAPEIVKAQDRSTPDFISGEVVTTGNGAVIKGTFGEISEKKELANGAVIEGAFYE